MKKWTAIKRVMVLVMLLAAGWRVSPVGADVTVNGTANDDTIYFGYSAPQNKLVVLSITGGAETVTYHTMSGKLSIYGGSGNDHIEALSKTSKRGVDFGDIANLTFTKYYLWGGTGKDKILGTPFKDWIYGGDGNDHLIGREGDDYINGQGGDDYIAGWGGNDLLYGSSGNDFIVGDQGDDSIWGGGGNDILVGGTGLDVIDGGSGFDTFRCRKADHAITQYDYADADTDCGDRVARVSIEAVDQKDPYLEWAYLTLNGDGVTVHDLTTSNAELLITDRAAGASILMSESGDMPFSGDFDRDGRQDDVGVYRSLTRRWYYDYNHTGSTNETRGPWGLRGDRPVVGDFDRDGKIDDVAVFRPSNRTWYYDFDHNGNTDLTVAKWGLAGDVPIAGDFDSDGFSDDVAVFRPSTRLWYYDCNHDGTTDATSGPWGYAGDIPLAGDFDRDGKNDDIALFRPANRTWYYDYNHDGTTDATVGPWGALGDIPLAGDFDGDKFADDVAVFRLSTQKWYYDYDHDGDTDPAKGAPIGPWGLRGSPLYAAHKQYPASCGPTSLAMVMSDLGLADTSKRLFFSRDLQDPAIALDTTVWDPATAVDVGYTLSMENIMYEGYHQYFASDPDWKNRVNSNDFLEDEHLLNTADHMGGHDGPHYQIRYDIGHVDWNPATKVTVGRVQKWTEYSPAVGLGAQGVTDEGLAYVANKFAGSHPDAYPADTRFNGGAKFASLAHFKAVVRGFIDHNIPVVLVVESGGHFNTLMGYWDSSAGFYIYTADPLDGWGRPFYGKPMRWKKIRVTDAPFRVGAVAGMMFFGHSKTGCGSATAWARKIDSDYGRNSLCGYLD